MNERKINVLVVEDSPTLQVLLEQVLHSDPALQVIGLAGSGEEALRLHARKPADVVLMDIHLPTMDGFETTRQIMSTQPVPIVICSASSDPSDVAATFRAIEAGAVAFVGKPPGFNHPDFTDASRNLIQTVKLMSEVKVVRRWSRAHRVEPALSAGAVVRESRKPGTIRIIAIGASTGGPPVLQTILAALPADFAAPVVVVQHISAGFLPGLVEWLGQTSRLRLRIAAQGELPLPGHVYFAPDAFHLGLNPEHRLVLTPGIVGDGICPSVAHLFRSVASVYGAEAAGVLLTGMGRDGADELKLLREAGGVTIAQDAQSSIVNGMPAEAIRVGAVDQVLAADEIGPRLMVLVGTQTTSPGPESHGKTSEEAR